MTDIVTPRKQRVDLDLGRRTAFIAGAVATPGIPLSIIAAVHRISAPAAWKAMAGFPRVGLIDSLPAVRKAYRAKARGAQVTETSYLHVLFEGINATIRGLAQITETPTSDLLFADPQDMMLLCAAGGPFLDPGDRFLREKLLAPQQTLDTLTRHVHALRNQGAAA
jgi:hypothetical protein